MQTDMYVSCFMYRWGCLHEKEALEVYTCQQSKHHTNLKTVDAGLFLCKE